MWTDRIGDGNERMAIDSVVKSAGRTLRVLELFAAERTPLGAAEISRRLAWPKSSTNVLLRSLASLGYLTVDPGSIEYFPSPKVASLGEWIPDTPVTGDDIPRRLEELNDRTGETVTLSMQNGFDMQFVTVLPGTFPISLNVNERIPAPIFSTAIGIALLATEPDDTIRRLVQRSNHRRGDGARRVEIAKVLAEVRATRERGHAVGYERLFPDTGAIAVAVRSKPGGRPLVIAVGGLAARVRRSEDQIAEVLRKCVGRLRIPLQPTPGAATAERP
jgi:DNA-binding IclR family transcriptional regulator